MYNSTDSEYKVGLVKNDSLPKWSSSCVIAFPIPVPPPVTMADLPLKSWGRKTLVTLFAAISPVWSQSKDRHMIDVPTYGIEVVNLWKSYYVLLSWKVQIQRWRKKLFSCISIKQKQLAYIHISRCVELSMCLRQRPFSDNNIYIEHVEEPKARVGNSALCR